MSNVVSFKMFQLTGEIMAFNTDKPSGYSYYKNRKDDKGTADVEHLQDGSYDVTVNGKKVAHYYAVELAYRHANILNGLIIP